MKRLIWVGALAAGLGVAFEAAAGSFAQAIVKVKVHIDGRAQTAGTGAEGSESLARDEDREKVWARSMSLQGWEKSDALQVLQTEDAAGGWTELYGVEQGDRSGRGMRFYQVSWPE